MNRLGNLVDASAKEAGLVLAMLSRSSEEISQTVDWGWFQQSGRGMGSGMCGFQVLGWRP